MGQQCLALRGREEGDPTSKIKENLITQNPGNFLAIIRLLVEQGCPVLKEHIETCANKNAHYLSKNIQNELLKLIALDIVDQLVSEIKEAKVFSVLGDEAMDISTKEQMPIIFRFIDKSNTIREVFVKMAECVSGVSGKAIAKTILESVKSVNLDMESCRGQGYDGAGSMSGKISGAATRICEESVK
ncbi:52 kDa repressor of the inhibitor of the protein kinase-like [Clytia hemisphaerica]|uniref:52 kDa repressor of the inhibitor of the protein kinase-like n=1 Tax=Clytia hemisphaerica TaxID=252671 RepID=UPI0034D79AB3